jgi:uncharacterized membrane protein
MEAVKHIEGEKMSALWVFSGSFLEGLIGAGAIALAIIGLATIMPMYMAAIASIAVGAAFFFNGFMLGTRFRSITSEITQRPFEAVQLGWGVAAEFFGGAAGIVLGILALLQIYPAALVPITAIIYGATLIFSSAMVTRLNALRVEERPEPEHTHYATRNAVVAAADTQVLIGLGAVVLGILSILGLYPLILSLVALLSVACADLFSGTTLVSRMVSLFRR